MSFFSRRTGPAVTAGGSTTSAPGTGKPVPGGGPSDPPAPTPVDNHPLISCCRHLANCARDLTREHDQHPAAGPGPDGRLHRDLLAVGLEFDRVMTDPLIGVAVRAGDKPWPVLAPHLLDLLLAAAAGAVATDPSLTGLIADTVLRARRGSRAAWRLRALAHEQWGDLTSAIDAHQEYLARTEVDKLGVSGLVVGLRGLRDARVALASALIDAHDVTDVLPMPGAADLHDLLSRPVRQETLDPVLEEFLSDLTRLPVAELTEVRDVLQGALHCLRTSQSSPPPLPADTLPALAVLRSGDLRRWLAGRSICLVADPGRMAAAGAVGLGARIDGYDLVARCTGGPLAAADHGSRTDLMVTRHDRPTGWDQPAGLRLVLAEDPQDWVHSVRQNLVPGAQRGLFDKSLRRPARQPAVIGAEPRPRHPSDAYQLLRLLDHLDVSPAIDLIGFGPGDPFTDQEQDWLRPRIQHADDHLVRLR